MIVRLPIVLFIGQPHYFYLHCYLLHLLSSSLFVGEEACPSRCTNFRPFTEFIICQLSTVTQSLNSLQIVYDKHYNISGGASSVDYNIKCNTKKYGHHTHFRVKCNYHKTKGTEVEYEVLYTFYTI